MAIMLAWIPHLITQSSASLATGHFPYALHPYVIVLSSAASTIPSQLRRLADADLIILHEYGEPSHYTGAMSAAAELGYSTVVQVEFTPLRKLKQGVEQGRGDRVRKALRDACYLALWTLFPRLLKGKTVILGMAPLDWRITVLSRALRDARVIYHSSWIDWGGARYAKNPTVLAGAVHHAWARFLTSRVDRFALVTPRTAEQLHSVFKVDCERVFVVFHAFDQKVFHPAEGWPSVPLKVVFAGRLDESKGVPDVVELARRLPSVEFGLAGDGPLRRSIESAGLPNLTLFGRVNGRAAISSIFMQHHVVILPSKRTSAWEELFGMALVEAMACGCIPITTNHIGPRTILRDGDLKELIFSEEDFLTGATSVLKALEEDVDRRRRLAKKSVEESSRFALSEIEKIWVKILQ